MIAYTDLIVHTDPQGSPEWHSARRGVITGSRFKDCRDYNQPTAAEKKAGEVRGKPSKAMLAYAMDVARERAGGVAPSKFVTTAMRTGTDEEPRARLAYEEETGLLVEEAGFITTADGMFGVSVDGFVGQDGIVEIKTMVSSDTLFRAVVDGDHSEYIDQINGALWLLGRKWCDLVLWAPDLEPLGRHLTIRRISRDEDAFQALEDDLMLFAGMVARFERALKEAA